MTDLGPALTLGEMVDRAASRFPDRIAVVFKQERISYGDLKRRADDFARGLLALGLGPGDHVVLWMPNRVEWNVANLGIAKIGAVTVTCNSRYKAFELEYVLRQSDARALIMVDRFAAASVDYLEILREAGSRDRFPALRHVIVLGSERPARALAFDDVERAGRAGGADLAGIRVRPEDPVEMLYTSGTTGEPKGCLLSHGNMYYKCRVYTDLHALDVGRPLPGAGAVLPHLRLHGRRRRELPRGLDPGADGGVRSAGGDAAHRGRAGDDLLGRAHHVHHDPGPSRVRQVRSRSLRTGSIGAAPVPVEIMRRILDRERGPRHGRAGGLRAHRGHRRHPLDAPGRSARKRVSTVGAAHRRRSRTAWWIPRPAASCRRVRRASSASRDRPS